MDGIAGVRKRDCGADTRAMAEFARRLFDLSWVERAADDLAAANGGKVGHPFVFPDSVFVWGLTLRSAFRLSYRLARGIVNRFLKDCGIGEVSHTQFYDRCRMLSVPRPPGADADSRILACGSCDVAVSEDPISVAVDSTGISLSKYGGWLAHRWDMKPVTGWIKIHAAVDVDTNRILAYAVTDENCGDPTCLDLLMEQVLGSGHRVGKLLADAAYDTKAAWSKYSAMGIEVAINIKTSQLGRDTPSGHYKGRSHGCMARGRQIRRIVEVGRDQWKLEMGYGRRWKVECTFSDLKRLFGDVMRARARMTDAAEAVQMVRILNIYKECRISARGSDRITEHSCARPKFLIQLPQSPKPQAAVAQ